MPESTPTPPSTPDPTTAQAATHVEGEGAPAATGDRPQTAAEPASEAAAPSFELGEGVGRAAMVAPYERQDDDPLYRPLKIFALDPAAERLEGSVALVNVPYEPLADADRVPGDPVRRRIAGRVFVIEKAPSESDDVFVDLNDPKVLISQGLDPSPADRRFHYQMVYAVCSTVYTAFLQALGRPVAWGFDGTLHVRPPGQWQLRVYPHDREAERNAWYDHWTGSLHFGYYRGDKKSVRANRLPAGLYFTCLSHDIVAHEVTHALLDGLRARLSTPTHIDVLAFHEAFSDLVAIFQHFSYDKVVRSAILRTGGDLGRPSLLTDLAREFGQTTGSEGGIRSAIDVVQEGQMPPAYDRGQQDPHVLGSVLLSAVFEAFIVVFRRKTRRYFELAGGTGGSTTLSPTLVDILAEEASHLAAQFLAMCIRAIDYCPPVDIRFGEYLRALITADRDLVPDDRYAFREALIDAFRRRAIFPDDVDHLSEDALLWQRPERPVEIDRLSFKNLRFEGDPQHAASAEELDEQANALGRTITSDPQTMQQFGLLSVTAARAQGMQVDPPIVESIRSARRAGPQGQIVFDVVAEVTQRRVIDDGALGTWDFYGGATIILDPRGMVRYVIRKRVDHKGRLNEQRDFLTSDLGRKLWGGEGGSLKAMRDVFKLVHQGAART